MGSARSSALRTTLRRIPALALAVVFAYGAYVYLTLPDVRTLRTSNPGMTAFMELRVREARARGEKPRRIQQWVDYNRISGNLKRAVLVSEDAKFWQHEGLDLESLKESIEVNLERREFARGASTITQQLAKNLYLSPSKNPVRKLRELLIARRLEAELSKQRILELYLNVIEWGDGVYGAEAAARIYFRKSAADLTVQESALLAAALVNPRLFDVGHPTARLRRRQQMIVRRMGAAALPAAAGHAPPTGGRPIGGKTAPGARSLPELPSAGAPPALPGEVVPAEGSTVPPCDEPPCG